MSIADISGPLTGCRNDLMCDGRGIVDDPAMLDAYGVPRRVALVNNNTPDFQEYGGHLSDEARRFF